MSSIEQKTQWSFSLRFKSSFQIFVQIFNPFIQPRQMSGCGKEKHFSWVLKIFFYIILYIYYIISYFKYINIIIYYEYYIISYFKYLVHPLSILLNITIIPNLHRYCLPPSLHLHHSTILLIFIVLIIFLLISHFCTSLDLVSYSSFSS